LKHSGPLLGYNNNIPYKGQVFHVQTEDSGSKRPHVITHLFADGGRVVKTMKTSYQHFLGSENSPEKVRALMREQHKSMVISLRDGDLDILIEEGGAEIEEREAPRTVPPPPVEEEPKDNEEEEVDVATSGTPSSRPIDLLERAAAEDDSEFIREIEQLVPDKKRTPGDRSAGTYSFVGQKKSPPPKKSSPPPRRMQSTRPLDADSDPGATPPAAGMTTPPRAGSGSAGSGSAGSGSAGSGSAGSGSAGSGSADAATPRREQSRTDPDLKVAHQHVAARNAFGAGFIGEHRFDKIVRAFLERQ
jgi:hypothetical protein